MGQGLGAQIIRSLIDDLQVANIRCIQLMAADDPSVFYEELGFRSRPAHKPGMEFNMPE
jgi:predicted N-acetyltransferase YhbS